jgi:predicted secreted protein
MTQAVLDMPQEGAPYPPSWFDRLSAWLESLPAPLWLVYLGLAVLSTAAMILLQASQGAYSSRRIDPWHAFFVLQPVFYVALMHYLDHAAAAALDRFRPVLAGGEAELRNAYYRLTTLPARPVRWATLAGVLVFLVVLGPSAFQISQQPFRVEISSMALQVFGMSTSAVSRWVIFIIYLALWGVVGVAVLHTVRQLGEIRRLYAGVSAANPFQPEPLYAFSSVTALTAVMMLLNSYGWVGVLLRVARETPGAIPLTGPISVNVFFAALSVFLFVWPLWGAHRLLDSAKKHALGNNAGYFQAVVGRLHAAIEGGDPAGVDGWQKMLGALELERARLDRLPTWPWRPEASRGLVAALVVPIAVWLLQFVLGKLLG